MIRFCGALLALVLVSGCATTKVADTYPADWTPTSTPVGMGPLPATGADSIATAYVSPDQCYVVIEDKVPVVEICQKGNFISYNPLSAEDMVSIVPPEINGVLVLQGHLLPMEPLPVDLPPVDEPALTAAMTLPTPETVL